MTPRARVAKKTSEAELWPETEPAGKSEVRFNAALLPRLDIHNLTVIASAHTRARPQKACFSLSLSFSLSRHLSSVRRRRTVMAQSVALDHYSVKVDSMLETFTRLNSSVERTGASPRTVYVGGWIPTSPRPGPHTPLLREREPPRDKTQTRAGVFSALEKESLFRLVARNNTLFTDVIAKIGLLERSDTAWKYDHYARARARGAPSGDARKIGRRKTQPERIEREERELVCVARAVSRVCAFATYEGSQVWDGMREEFELDERFQRIEYKLNLIQHNTKFFLEILANQKSNVLEIIIIVLISLEIIVCTAELCDVRPFG